MKKDYSSPEWELFSFKLTEDVLAASDYTPDPEDPGRSGNDKDDDDFGGMISGG